MIAEGSVQETTPLPKVDVLGGLERAFSVLKALILFVGLTGLVIGDILLGAAVLPYIFAPLGPVMSHVLAWIISVSTSAVEIALWAFVFSSSKGSMARIFVSTLGKVIGLVFALAVSLIDTVLDALFAQVAVFGTLPTVFPPMELNGLAEGLPIFWLIFLLFGIISLFGEPIVLFVIMSNKKGQ